ncbi:MAG: hypothetical protein RMJ89_13295, partial [Flammeovirgaceae bacterium]|nr:hypothetical protein [Flammeovirgaceae bacterium]
SILSGTNFAASGFAIDLKGNWINNHTFTPSGNTVTFSGTSNPQTITGTTTFYDLVINNTHSGTPTVTLNNDITISNALTLTAGRVVLGNNNLTIDAGAALSYTGGWVETNGTGRLIRNGSGSDVEFPVGDATGRRLVTMSSTGVGANWVRFTTSISPSITGTNPAAGMWIIERPTGTTQLKFSNVGGTADATSRIYYDNSGTWTLVDTKTSPLPPPYETVNPESFTGTSRTYTVFTPSPPLYSRKSGDWNDISPGDGTWSLVSHTGPSCDCVPTASNNVFIDKDHEVTIPTGYTAMAQSITLVDKGSGTSGGRLKVEGT